MHKTGIINGKKDYSVVDYRKFRLRKLNTPEFSHVKYLLYWPIFGILFLTVERLFIRQSYFPIHCALDDLIPFCEFFLIPYLFWFVFLVGIHVYSLLFDVESFKKFMIFIMVSYSVAILVYLIFPNCQELRPMTFERDNIFTRFMIHFYAFDTNTNVCPSIHVIGSVAVAVCAWKSKHLSGPVSRTVFALLAALISVSTVFLKQHSVIDVAAAIPVCILAYVVAYGKKRSSRERKLR